MTSDRHGPKVGRSVRSTEEAGQCPPRKGTEQNSLLDEGYTAAPEAEPTVSTKLAELAARARKEARLTNVVQFADEELLRLAFRSLRKQAAPGVDGQSYEDYAVNLNQKLRDLHTRLKCPALPGASDSAGVRAKAQRKTPPDRYQHDRRPCGPEGGGVGAQRSVRSGFS